MQKYDPSRLIHYKYLQMFQKKSEKFFPSPLDLKFNTTLNLSNQNTYSYNYNKKGSIDQNKFFRPAENRTEILQTSLDNSNLNTYRDRENQFTQLANRNYTTSSSLDGNHFQKSKKTHFESQPLCQLDLRQSDFTAYRDLSMNTSSSNICNNNFLSNNASMQESKQQTLLRENIFLKRENQNLKSEIEKLKRNDENDQLTTRERNKLTKLEKERQELQKKIQKIQKDYEKKAELSLQQNILYRQITEKLQKRIQVLLKQNSQLNETVKKSLVKLKEMQYIQEKFEQIKNQYCKLEYIVQQDNAQWQKHKQLWMNEKDYYKEIIRKLEFQLKLK